MTFDRIKTSGFLPDSDPLISLPKPFEAWEEVAHTFPKLLVAGKLRETVEKLSPFDYKALASEREHNRAMQILSYLGHGYVWGHKELPRMLPSVLAKPWYEVATKLGRPPVLSYASYSLQNWRRLDPKGPIALGNIVLVQNFLGGIDEEWFVLVHVDIERKAIAALSGCLDAIDAVKNEDIPVLTKALQAIQDSLEKMCTTLDRMPEHCDPYIYYHRVRPYLHGWKGHPSFTEGLIYEGVEAYKMQPQRFRGETGAQSSIMPTLDGLFGITHAPDELRTYLQEMRDYMPPEHREFLAYVETSSTLRTFVKEKMEKHPELRALYNSSIELIERFRLTHLGYAGTYIQKQQQLSTGNPNAVGTGGTPFMQYLKKHKDETVTFLL